MKNAYLLFLLLTLPFIGFSQETLNGSLMHDDLQREYIIYIPANYTGDDAVPLVFNFHGFTSNAFEQMFYGDFRSIADTAGFIIVHPEGTVYNGNTHFNVGGFTTGSTIDDVGFTEALLDQVASDYNIDLSRVYSTGMSNGGFMSFLLACQLSNKIAAVASVTGSMTPQTYNDCDPQHPTPVLQIHGTDDSVVPYAGNPLWTYSVDNVVAYWVNFNNNLAASIIDLPDTNTDDESTVRHFVYESGDNGVVVEHFKITGGDHTWAGTPFGQAGDGTNYDINASQEVWRFFSQYDINGLITATNSDDLENPQLGLQLFPNPTSSSIQVVFNAPIQADYSLVSPIGKRLLTGKINGSSQELDLTNLPAGIYFLNIDGQSFRVCKTN